MTWPQPPGVFCPWPCGSPWPERLFAWRPYRAFFIALFTALIGVLIYLCFVEYFFFDEFDARFNTVAVDYLLYPHEVFVNIWESYPWGAPWHSPRSRPWRSPGGCAGAWPRPGALRRRKTACWGWRSIWRPRPGHCTVGQQSTRFHQDRVFNELAGNGHYSFFWRLFETISTMPHYSHPAARRGLRPQPAGW